MTRTPARRDPTIELMRIFACLCVIMLHLPNRITLTDAFTCNAVPLFFSITGCFWFSGKRSYAGIVKHFLTAVLLPMLALEAAAQVFSIWFFTDSLSFSGVPLQAPDWAGILQGVLHLDYTRWTGLGGHTWYVADFLKLLLYYIPMKLVAQHPDKKLRLTVTGIILAAVLILDLRHVLPLPLQDWLPEPVLVFPSYFVMMMIGQEMYAHRSQFKHRWVSLCGLVGFLILTGIRYWLDSSFTTVDGAQPFLTAASTFSFLSLPLLYMIFLPLRLSEKLGSIIRVIGGCTYGIFLIHPLVIRKLTFMGVMDRMMNAVMAISPKLIIGYCLLAVCAGIFVFLLSCLLVLPVRAAGQALKGVLHKA